MKPIGHVMILASAGSGKTYALTNRFVQLLALGAKPERIVALTFTRKAAGEFFDEILNKLARAAEEKAFAERLAKEVGVGASGEEARRVFLRMLRDVVDAMHRLRLGTLDGFFARVARAFPLELGLAGEFEVLQEHGARVERRRVLRRMFERGSGGLAPEQREFIEAFKRATFGADEKRLAARLDGFLDRHQEIFLAGPEMDGWGNPKRIWPEGSRWAAAGAEATKALSALQAWVEVAPIADKQRGRWRDFIQACQLWNAGVTPDRPMLYVLEKALDAWDQLHCGSAVLEFDRKKQELAPPACAALATIVRDVIGREIERRLEMTRGIHAVLAGYEAVYHEAVRRAGKLTFGDVQRLLTPENGAPRLSGGGETTVDRLAIDYRLDGEIDHWLLDEFQDTSFGQWSVLRNLIDEVVQDASAMRTFFYVGDVKQAIFTWREGDPRLFREIFDHYNAIRPGTIAEQHLVHSWRSGEPVIATVNQVFGDKAVLQDLFPEPATDMWTREWQDHKSARPELGGQVALLHGPAAGSKADEERARFEIAVELLQEIDPLERGLTCALLVQDNKTATALADYVRRFAGMPALAESDLHVCTDNPLGAALLALMQAAAHPGDTLAQEHLRMTPLGAVLADARIETPETLTRRVLGQIHAEGFERTVTTWIQRLEPALEADDAFTRERARQFAAAARLFDETGSREVAEFIAFMERHTVRESEAAAAVRVMTIHKSKGLGFDVVILPDLEGNRIDSRRDGLAVQRSAVREIEWVLDLPSKVFFAADPVLAAHVRAAEADACYENLSLLYVAMTRAKRAMYLIAKPPGSSTSRNFTKLLAETLGEETRTVNVGGREFAGAFSVGDARWFEALGRDGTAVGEKPKEAAETMGAEERLELGRVRRWPARRASAGKVATVAGAQLFSLQRSGAADFGTAVHGLLAEVEWMGEETVAEVAETWRARGVEEELCEEALACLRAAELRGLWRRPNAAQAEVWRERSFEVVVDGAWITGVFDRVIVERSAAGAATRVTVIDFKTDRANEAELPGLAARHASQLNTYRRVAAILAGVEEAAVEAVLVFTRMRRSVVVKDSDKG